MQNGQAFNTVQAAAVSQLTIELHIQVGFLDLVSAWTMLHSLMP
jgi:hypothetical protein